MRKILQEINDFTHKDGTQPGSKTSNKTLTLELFSQIATKVVATHEYSRREFLNVTARATAWHAIHLGDKSLLPRQQRGAKFRTLLQIPPLLRPTHTDATTDFYVINQQEALAELLPGQKTAIWGYEGLFPGPTIRVRQGRRTAIRHVNRLSVPTVVHLHGGRTPPDSDGFPTDFVMQGSEKTYFYPNDRAATLWYHDHAMDHTGRNIFMGLAGLYIVEGQQEQNLPLRFMFLET